MSFSFNSRTFRNNKLYRWTLRTKMSVNIENSAKASPTCRVGEITTGFHLNAINKRLGLTWNPETNRFQPLLIAQSNDPKQLGENKPNGRFSLSSPSDGFPSKRRTWILCNLVRKFFSYRWIVVLLRSARNH